MRRRSKKVRKRIGERNNRGMNRGKLLNDVLSNVGKLFVVSSDELFDCTMVTNLKARRREAIKERQAGRQAGLKEKMESRVWGERKSEGNITIVHGEWRSDSWGQLRVHEYIYIYIGSGNTKRMQEA